MTTAVNDDKTTYIADEVETASYEPLMYNDDDGLQGTLKNSK